MVATMMVPMREDADTRPQSPAQVLPALAAENHVCAGCELAYAEISIEHAQRVIAWLPATLHEAARAIPPQAHHQRPRPSVWSVTEYVCHLRDVYVTYTIRLHRTCTEDRPALEPMLNDLRARRFRYNEQDLHPVLDQLTVAAAGFREEIGHVGAHEWQRTAIRLPGEQRTAGWLVRQAMHEGVHHLGDIRAIGEAVAPTR